MPLTENKNWLMLFVANQPGQMVSGMPMKGGVSANVMEEDVAALEKLLFLSVRRWAGGVVHMAIAPFGWGYLRTRADAVDTLTHCPPERHERSVIPIKVKPVLRLAYSE